MASPMTTDPSTDPSTAEVARTAASDTTQAAGEQAKAVAATATDQAQQVVGQAKEQAASVAGEARAQAQQVLATASSELTTQLDVRLGSATSAARTTSDELRALAEGRHEDAGRAGDFAHEASQRLATFADRVDELGVRGVTEEVTDFARRRPVAFLVAAGAAGLLVGHLARTGKEAAANGGSSSGPPKVGSGDSPLDGLAPTPVLPGSTDPQVPLGQVPLSGVPEFPADPQSPTGGGML